MLMQMKVIEIFYCEIFMQVREQTANKHGYKFLNNHICMSSNVGGRGGLLMLWMKPMIWKIGLPLPNLRSGKILIKYR